MPYAGAMAYNTANLTWTATFSIDPAGGTGDGEGVFSVTITDAGGMSPDTETIEGVNVTGPGALPLNVGTIIIPAPPPPAPLGVLVQFELDANTAVAQVGGTAIETNGVSVVLEVQKLHIKRLRPMVRFAATAMVVQGQYIARIVVPTNPNADANFRHVLRTYLLNKNGKIVGTATQTL